MRRPLLLFMLSPILLASCGQALAESSLTLPRVTPAAGDDGDLFTFTVRYSGEGPAHIRVFIGENGHDIREVDPTDNNTADGKDYYLRMEQGVGIFYFKAAQNDGQEARTLASTVNVRPKAGIRMDHLDVVFAVLVFIAPTAWALFMIRRLSKDLRDILDRLKGQGGSE